MHSQQHLSSGEAALKHLEFVQNNIARLSGYTFLLKGWSVTLVAAILALNTQFFSAYLVMVALIPILVFWSLDAFYLRAERAFRELYKDLLKGQVEAFSMDTTAYGTRVDSWAKTAFSNTLVLFHGAIMGVAVVVVVVLLLAAPEN